MQDEDLDSIFMYIEKCQRDGREPCDEVCDKSSEEDIIESKQFRKDLDETLQKIKGADYQSRERSLAITKIQEGIMWLGMDLKALNEPNPYPESYNPENAKVEPTADGLTM